MRPRWTWITLAALGIAAAACLTAPAQEAKDLKVRKLLELTGASQIGEQMLGSLLDQYRAMEQGGGLPAGFTEKFKAAAKPQELVDRIVPIYGSHFSEEDLDAAIAFWDSPAGRRMSAAQPEILKASITEGQKWGQETAQKVLKELKPPPPAAP